MIPDPILDPIYLKDNWADNGEKAISLNTWDNAVSTFRMIDKDSLGFLGYWLATMEINSWS